MAACESGAIIDGPPLFASVRLRIFSILRDNGTVELSRSLWQIMGP